MALSFRREDRGRVMSGEITVTFRLWKSARARAGKAYETEIGIIEIEDVRVIPAALVTPEDVALAGCADVQAVWDSAGEHAGMRVGPDTLLYRVQFRCMTSS